MKQKPDEAILKFPKEPPKTIHDLYLWHRALLGDAIFFEFKQRAIRASLNSLSTEMRKYVGWLKSGNYPEAKVALKFLNVLAEEFKADLKSAKQAIRMVHDTNEWILVSLLQAAKDDEFVKYVMAKPKVQSPNILHEPGWLYELAFANHLEKQGRVPFITFGTMFEPEGFDVISLPDRSIGIEWEKGWPPGGLHWTFQGDTL